MDVDEITVDLRILWRKLDSTLQLSVLLHFPSIQDWCFKKSALNCLYSNSYFFTVVNQKFLGRLSSERLRGQILLQTGNW